MAKCSAVPCLLAISWYYFQHIGVPWYKSLYYGSTTVFSVRAFFVRPAVLVPIRVYGKYHIYDDLSALCCVFSTIYSECQNWLFTKNVLECHDQRAAVVETELLIIPLHSTHKNAALPVKSCSDTSLMRNKSHCVAVLSVQYIVSPSQTPNRVLIEEIQHTLDKAVCSIVLYSQVNL